METKVRFQLHKHDVLRLDVLFYNHETENNETQKANRKKNDVLSVKNKVE